MKQSIILFVFSLFFVICKAQNSIINTSWKVVSLYEKSSNSSKLNNSQFPGLCELNFHEKTLLVNTCNGYSLSYQTKKNKLTFTNYPPGLQTKFCNDGFANTIEEFIFSKIKSPITFIIKTDSLVLQTLDLNIITCTRKK